MVEELPDGWGEYPLDDLVQILDSRRVPVNATEREQRLAASDHRYPYYGATGQVGDIDDYLFEGEAVLLGEDGAPFLDHLRPKAYVVNGKFWVNNHAHILRGNGAIENAFLSHQLNISDYRRHVSGTTRLKLTQANMRQIWLRVPPVNEQRRIVDKIETLFAQLDKGEEAVRQVQKLLVRYRQSILKAAVTGELTADWRAERAGQLEHGRELLSRVLKERRRDWSGRGNHRDPVAPAAPDLPQLPHSWTWASPEQLSKASANSLCIGPFGSNLKVEDYRDSGVPLVFVRHIRARYFSGLNPKYVDGKKAKELSSHQVFPGDLLITKMGEPPGDVCMYPKESPAAIITADCIRFAPASPPLEVRYLETAISSPVVQQQIKKIAKGVAQQKVTLANFKRIAIPLPPQAEQLRIVELVDDALSRTTALLNWCEAELLRSASLRQAILRDAFAGRLVPQDPDDEPASALLARIAAENKAARGTRREVNA